MRNSLARGGALHNTFALRVLRVSFLPLFPRGPRDRTKTARHPPGSTVPFLINPLHPLQAVPYSAPLALPEQPLAFNLKAQGVRVHALQQRLGLRNSWG